MTSSRPLLAYGLLGLPLAFAALPVYVHVPRFYAAERGVELALLGGVLLALRLGDAVIDPWLGRLADRLPRRRLLLLALPLCAIGFVGLFNPPAPAGVGWLATMLALTCLGHSLASIVHQAWGAAAGRDPLQRTRLTAAREGCMLAGVLLAAVLPTWLGGGDPDSGLGRLGWLLPPLLALAFWLGPYRQGQALPAMPDRNRQDDATGGDWRRLLATPAVRRLLGLFVLNGVASALPATLFLFFVADVLGRPEAGGPLLGLYFLAGAAGLPLWLKLAGRLGRPLAWLLGMGLAGLSFLLAGTLQAGDLPLFALICLCSGLALGADLALPAALAADLGERLGCSGTLFGIWNLCAKLNLALAAGLALPLLALFGYTPGSDATTALSLTYAVLPLLFKSLAAGLLWRWRHQLEN